MKSYTFPFDCFCCGICCRCYQVRLGLSEAKNIADGLGICWDEFSDNYLDHHWPGRKSFLLRQNRGICVFLQRDPNRKVYTCRIYSFRPSSCQEWKPGLHRVECQHGLTKYWGLEVDEKGELKGSKRRIQSFQKFMQLLKRN